MTSLKGRGILQVREQNTARIGGMAVGFTEVWGRILTTGTGDTTVDVAFPVTFADVPLFTSGGVLGENFIYTSGSIPTGQATVIAWKRSGQTDIFDGYYVGATLGLVVTGISTQQLWVNWSAKGKAFTNPTTGQASQPF